MRKWTKEEIDFVAQEYRKGATNTEMARALKRSRGGIDGRVKALRADGLIPFDRPVTKYAFWTPAREKELREMWVGGASSGTCAKALGCTRNAVMSKVRGMGLLRSPKAYKPKRGRFAPLDVNAKIRTMFAQGSRISDIGGAVRLRTAVVRERLRQMGLEPVDAITQHVHPMWGMEEDARRLAFIEKFNTGWADVQKRLRAA